MNNYSINKYNFSSSTSGLDFVKYFKGEEDWLQNYEPILDYVKANLPANVNTVIIFGCASGRDFIPFQDTFTCAGFDIAPFETINWVCKTDNLHYFECSVEDFMLNIENFEVEWQNTLVYSQGTLMYVSHDNQTKLVKLLIDKGCKNLVFHEYPKSAYHECFNPAQEVLSLFERKHFRATVETQPTGFLYLNK